MNPPRLADKAREGVADGHHVPAESPTRPPREWNRELGPACERDARDEIERLRDQIEGLVQVDEEEPARDAVDSALSAVTRLQVVTGNLDACHPPPASFAGPRWSHSPIAA